MDVHETTQRPAVPRHSVRCADGDRQPPAGRARPEVGRRNTPAGGGAPPSPAPGPAAPEEPCPGSGRGGAAARARHEARDQLLEAVKKEKVTKAQAAAALSKLDSEIGDLVQMAMRSSEGDLLHQPKLRSHLAYLAGDAGQAYAQPTPAMYSVYKHLDQHAKAGEQKLQATIAEARKLL